MRSGSGLVQLLAAAALLLAMCGGAIAEPEQQNEYIPGWMPGERMEFFQPDELWEHINGAADHFLSFGCQRLVVMEITDGERTVAIEIYEMGSRLNAWGLFRDQVGESGGSLLDIGDGATMQSHYQGLLLCGSDYNRIEPIEGDLDEETGIAILNAFIEKRKNCGLPGELNSLPGTGRVKNSEGFRRESFLGLGELRNCIFADYEKGSLNFQVFLMLPGPEQDLTRAWRQIAEKWEERDYPFGRALVRQIPYKGIVGLLWGPDHFLGVAGLESEEMLVRVLDELSP